ncbi:universal stress protein [Myxococcota bacterium]|jgi:nucleotide-binding universal stress UspA family protein|nr:universal stress protein [Myxococcota bacterium]
MFAVPPKHILLATDLSEASAPAAAYAGLLARRFGARVMVVHAEHLELPPYFAPEQHERLREEAAAARERATRLVAESVAGALGFVPEARVVEGHPADAIASCARECQADLVVMGTHGRRGVRRLWLGSVAESVVRECERPVLTVHAGTRVEAPTVVELVGNPLDVRANEIAATWAQAFGASLQCRAPDAGPSPSTESPALIIAAGDHPERGLRRTTQPFLALPLSR